MGTKTEIKISRILLLPSNYILKVPEDCSEEEIWRNIESQYYENGK